MLEIFSSPPFYTEYVQLPKVNDPIPPQVQLNPKRYPFFKDVIGAIDGTHIICSPKKEERKEYVDRNNQLTQNCLMACSFDLRFLYVLSGWEGSASDTTLFYDARGKSFPIPNGKYYLADAGFPLCNELLIPYRGQRYGLTESGSTEKR
jgi:DDE superfamily endonuclease